MSLPNLSYWRSLDTTRIVPGFLRHQSRSRQFREQLAGLAGSTDMAPYLSLIDQRRMHITLPPLPEQRAIAHILGTLDDKIELNRRMNETLEGMARALYKSWFVDFDPVRAKAEGRAPGLPTDIADLFPARFEDSELGEIPQGWEIRTLDQSACPSTNGIPARAQRSASQDQVRRHATQTTRAAR
jgi:type I restriction enzyme, S subunit